MQKTYFQCEIVLQNKKLQSSSNQVRTLFLESLPPPPKKTLNMNKERSRRRITTRK